MKALEREWKGPPGQTDDPAQDWEPIKGLLPYASSWIAAVDGPDKTQGKRGHRLSAATVETIRSLWLGPCGTSEPRSKPVDSCHAGHFHCYRTSLRGKGEVVFRAWRVQNGGSPVWSCSSLREAGHRYSWTRHPAGSFEQLGAALQCAMSSRDELLTNVVCRKILDWGGVRDREDAARIDWLYEQTRRRSLISSIQSATRALRASSTTPLDALFAQDAIPMTSGTTKIFAAAALDFSAGWSAPTQDVLIFDGRVTAALGLIARRVSHAAPKAFRFPASRESKRRRDPSCAHLTFPNLHSISNLERARFARLGARSIEQVVGKSDFLLAEKALFMVGYDVRNLCDGEPRSCS